MVKIAVADRGAVRVGAVRVRAAVNQRHAQVMVSRVQAQDRRVPVAVADSRAGKASLRLDMARVAVLHWRVPRKREAARR